MPRKLQDIEAPVSEWLKPDVVDSSPQNLAVSLSRFHVRVGNQFLQGEGEGARQSEAGGAD